MYEVSEDSYLLRNTLRDHNASGRTAIDIGVGTGIITAYLAEVCDEVIGVDIDDEAVAHCKDKFGDNHDVHVKHSDMFSGITADADIITCNPPYLPSTAGEQSDPALDGGENGVEYTVRLLREAKHHLEANGTVYFVASDKADLDALTRHLDTSSYEHTVLNDTRYFFETLYVYQASLTC